MLDLLPVLTPILIVDVLNPVLFTLMIVAIGTNRPLANSTSLLFGHTFAYFASGILIALGLEQVTQRLETPHTIDSVIELILGVLILFAAFGARDGKASNTKEPEGELTPVYCFGYGAIVNFIGIPFALPYFAAVDQIMAANLSIESSLLALTAYNVAYALPFLLVPISVGLIGEQCKPFLERFNEILISIADKLMPLLLAAVGIFLIVDAIRFLVYGEAFF